MDIIIVIAYLGFLLFYGIYQGKKVDSMDDFALSGKTHGLFVIFAALSASFIGGGFSTGNAAEVFKGGIGNMIGLMGFSVGQVIIGSVILKRANIPGGTLSPGMLMRSGYGTAGQVMTGICSVLLCVGILGAQIASIGWIFNVLLNVPYTVGVLIGFTVVLIYSTAGGMSAIITAEVVEFLLLAVGLPLLLWFSLKYVGGLEALVSTLPPEYINPLSGLGAGGLVSLFITMLIGEAITPSYLQRIIIGKDRATISRATTLSGLVSVPVFVITGIVGLCAYAANSSLEPSLAMPYMVIVSMPPVLKGIVIAAMLAIVMSSADGLLSSAAIGLINDVYKPLRQRRERRKAGLKKSGFALNTSESDLMVIRITNVLLGLVGMAFALSSGDVFGMLLVAYSAWAPVMLVPVAALLLGRRINVRGFMFCGICGALVSALSAIFPGGYFSIEPTVAGFVLNLLLFLLIYRFDGRPKMR